MELVYSAQTTDFDPEKRYRNPAHFDRAEAGVTHVLVMGEWPKVVEAYEAVGIEVSVTKSLAVELVYSNDAIIADLEQENDNLRGERDGILRLVEAVEGLSPLEHPRAGELPIRLFNALDSVHGLVTSVTKERDDLAGEAELLRAEVVHLKAMADQPVDNVEKIAGLKAQLDAASVQYRANASVESLEKAVAELPKA
ncbi:hypothetical protein [Pseudomonas fontis]|uniref:Uncharacterized protein n=1 Tax=Pseudomonas fontis TaxID=2942633 RepID=A0ABT5NSE3_9PSED|nr:hypothetical protein [Pseudomonas fontis]MDD0974822.1 hypothetical protein [Pseudomonas fontis]MDD0991087.1 hypothetical protein [Pseudomonas fontis]